MIGNGIGDDIIRPNFNPKSHVRGAAVHIQYRWPNNVIPYDITPISG